VLRHLACCLRPCASAVLLAACVTPALAQVPAADHVFVVVMENKSYGEVRNQPYTAGLISAWTWFANSYAVTHPSQPNYLALWSGSTQGVTNDVCPPPGSPFHTANLGQACEAAGLGWRAYSENLATAGAANCSFDGDASTGLYTRKHDPWTDFDNVTHANERPYSDLAADLAAGQVPSLSFIIPNNCDNTHNSTCGVAVGDAWLAANLPPILGALGPNDVMILTWDEDDGTAGNNILTVFMGPLVTTHSVSVRTITHYTVARAIADLLRVPPPGLAANEYPLTDIWSGLVSARGSTWGRLKLRYR